MLKKVLKKALFREWNLTLFFATSIITTLISLSRILSLSFFSHFTVTVFVVVFVFGDVRGGRDLPVDERGGFCDSNYHHLTFLHLSLSLTLCVFFFVFDCISVVMLDVGWDLLVDESSGFCDSNYHHQHHQACQETQTHGDVGIR